METEPRRIDRKGLAPLVLIWLHEQGGNGVRQEIVRGAYELGRFPEDLQRVLADRKKGYSDLIRDELDWTFDGLKDQALLVGHGQARWSLTDLGRREAARIATEHPHGLGYVWNWDRPNGAPGVMPEARSLGVPYTPSGLGRQTKAPDPFTRDQDAHDRHTDDHERLLNELAAMLTAMGYVPELPGRGSIVPFDLAFKFDGGICVIEAKSLPSERATDRLRAALGQVLEYRWRLDDYYGQSVLAVIACAAEPPARWKQICAAVDVVLVARPLESGLRRVLALGASPAQPGSRSRP